MKLSVLFLSIALILISTVAYASVPKENTINIAYIGGLTGKLSLESKRSLNALKMVVDHYNENGGIKGKRIRIVTYDTKHSPTEVLNIASQLPKDNIHAITGVHTSHTALLLSKTVELNKIPMVVTSATHTDITKDKKYIVLITFDNGQQANRLVNFLYNDLKAKNILVVTDVSDSFTKNLTKHFKAHFSKGNGSIIKDFSIVENQNNYSDIIQYMAQSSNVDAVFLATSSLEAGYIITNMARNNIRIPIVGSDGLQSNDMTKIVSKLDSNLMNIYFNVHWFNRQSPLEQTFVKNFEKKYSMSIGPMNSDAVCTYDAATLLLSALKQATSLKPDDIMSAIKNISINGIMGELKIGPAGNVVRSIPIVTLKGNKLELYK